MKELNDESARILKSLDDRQRAWRRDPGLVVWAFWIGDDKGKAEAWAAKHKLDNIVFGVVSPNDPKLAKWKMHGMASNSLVLASRAKRAMITYTDLKMDDLHWLEEKLVLLVKLPDFPLNEVVKNDQAARQTRFAGRGRG